MYKRPDSRCLVLCQVQSGGRCESLLFPQDRLIRFHDTPFLSSPSSSYYLGGLVVVVVVCCLFVGWLVA